jgi:predicted transcriptional regulator
MLELATTAFVEIFDKSFSFQKNDLSNIQKELLDSPLLLNKHKKIIERAKAIGNDVQSMQQAVAKAIKVKEEQEKQQTQSKRKSRLASSTNSGDEKTSFKERRKLFKPLGNDRNWIPM